MLQKEKKGNEQMVEDYPYLDLLTDNSPQAYKEYYEEAAILNKQITEPNVFNIAVVAKYGAGKSSVINTYLSRYRNKKTKSEKKKTTDKQLAKPENNKYTRISLSTFNKNDYDEVAIERSILQQLLYSRKKSKLPNSKIERTNKSSKVKSIFFAILLTVFIVSTALMGIEFSLYGRDINTAGVTSLFGANWVKYVLLGLSTVLLFFIVLWSLHYRKLRKIKYKDLEADVSSEDDKNHSKQITNLINKFIDEVIYFFECIDIDLVIFEDLDRLPTTEIFVKLRELNTIINSSARRTDKVTFLYAVKDELFKTEEERAKFFEFILPVVPVINPITTKSEIESRLDELTSRNKEMELTGKFIKGISTYIPDMRVLKNTFNDYVMMYHKIFEDKNAGKNLKADNLFALCLYKNLFPYDYALLEKDEGLIPLVINMDILQNKCLSDINKKIEENKAQLIKIQNNAIASFDELKGVFITQLCKCKKTNSGGSINPWSISSFKDVDFSKIQYPYVANGEYNYGYAILIENGAEILTPKGERFIDVENIIKLKEQNGLDNIKNELADLEKQRQLVLSWGLSEIVLKLGINSCFTDDLNTTYNEIIKATLTERDHEFLKFLSSKYVNKINKNIVTTIKDAYETFKEAELPAKQIMQQINFLRFLVAQNYIDEHYIEYTSNYKAEILSPADIKVVQAIQSRQENFDANFENMSEVIRWLDDDDFGYISIISKSFLDNINLINELSKRENDKKFEKLISLLANTQNPAVLEILQKYIAMADENKCEQLLKVLIPKRTALCCEVIATNILSEDKKDFVFICHLKYSKKFKKQDIVSSYISNHNNYLHLFRRVSNATKVIEFLDNVKPLFILCEQNLNDKIQQHIIKNNLYQISLENLLIIFNIDKEDLDSDFYTKNYEFISSSKIAYVSDYIEANINIYVSNVLLNSMVTCKKESVDSIDKLLKNKSVDLAVKVALIAKINFEYDSITELDPELFEALFVNSKVAPSWVNIQFAYELKGFECVKDFIIASSEIKGNFVGCKGIKDDTPTKLINEILLNLNSEEVSDVAITLPAVTILSAINTDVSDDNLSSYINRKRIKFSSTDLTLLLEKPHSLCSYIEVYSKEIQAEFDTYFAKIIPQPIMQQRQVMENGFYTYKNFVVGYNEKAHTQSVVAQILAYKGLDIAIKKRLIEACSGAIKIDGYEGIYADYIVQERQAVPPKILWQFSKISLSLDIKLRILEICDYGGEIEDTSNLKDYLISMGGSYAELFDTTKNTNLAHTESNKNLLNILCAKKLISSYKKARNKEEYTVIAS